MLVALAILALAAPIPDLSTYQFCEKPVSDYCPFIVPTQSGVFCCSNTVVQKPVSNCKWISYDTRVSACEYIVATSSDNAWCCNEDLMIGLDYSSEDDDDLFLFF